MYPIERRRTSDPAPQFSAHADTFCQASDPSDADPETASAEFDFSTSVPRAQPWSSEISCNRRFANFVSSPRKRSADLRVQRAFWGNLAIHRRHLALARITYRAAGAAKSPKPALNCDLKSQDDDLRRKQPDGGNHR